MSDEDQRIAEAIRKGLVDKSPYEQAKRAQLAELEQFSENAYKRWMTELSREIKEDLATRSFTATPTTTVEKLEAAVLLIGEKESMPWLFEEGHGKEFKDYIRALKGELMSGWKPIVPFAALLAKKTNPSIGRDMRDFKHILTLVKMVALLHFYVRPKITIEGRKYVLATMEDFKTVLRLWKDIEETTRSGLSGEEIVLYNCLLKLEAQRKIVRQSDIVDEYNKEQTKKISTPTAYKYLSNLCNIGYVDKKKDDRSKEDHPDADARYNLYWSLKNPRNAISKAWEYFPQSFTLKELENWFVGLLNYYPEKQLLINIKNEKGKMKDIVLALDEDDKIDKKQVIKNLFSGYYYSEPTEPVLTPDSQEKLPKYSHGENKTFEGISDTSLQEKTDWILGQLSTREKTPDELSELSGMTLTEVDNILAYMSKGTKAPIYRAGTCWRKS